MLKGTRVESKGKLKWKRRWRKVRAKREEEDKAACDIGNME